MNSFVIFFTILFIIFSLIGYCIHYKSESKSSKTVLQKKKRVPPVGMAKVFDIPKDRVLEVMNKCAEVEACKSRIQTKIAKVELRFLLEEILPAAFDETPGFWYILFSGTTPYLLITDYVDSDPLTNHEIELEEGWHTVDLSNCKRKHIRFENTDIRSHEPIQN